MKDKKIWNSLTKTIFTRLFITLVVFSASLFGLLILGKVLLTSIWTWERHDPFYRFSQFILDKQITIWFIGIIIICLYFLYKSLKYIDVLINASSELINSDDKWINLPKELNDVEKRMNEIKQTAIKNSNKAIENEQRKNDLIVYLAHDIKTPLTSIIGYLSLLNDEEEISKKTRQKYLNITLDKSNKLEHLINELFDVARYNSENIILEKENLNINLMIEQIIDEFYPILKEQKKKIQFDESVTVMYDSDPNKLARVFNNIIKNAISYSFPRSTIFVKLTKEDKNIVIDVQNKGKKIPEAKLSKIFDRFYRMDSSRTSKTGGSGLGLAIAKDIVGLHNGKISVLSNDENTTFTIILPTK